MLDYCIISAKNRKKHTQTLYNLNFRAKIMIFYEKIKHNLFAAKISEKCSFLDIRSSYDLNFSAKNENRKK